MRRFLIPTLAFLAASAAFVFAQVATDDDPVVARLGSTTETLSEFETRFEIALRSVAASRGMPMTDQLRQQLTALRPAYLDQRATEIALVAEAEERGIEVSDADVNAQIEQLRANAGDETGFADLLEQSGIGDEAALRALLRENLLIQGLYERIEAEQDIGDDQLRTAYEARRDQFTTPEQVCARHILLDTVEDAEATLEDLNDGADFAELAAERSTGPTGPDGGDLGCFGRGQMVGPFEQAAFDAEVGTPVGPIETRFGQHVILVTERREAGVAPFADVQEQLRNALVQEATQTEVQALVEGAGVVTYPDRLPEPEAPAPQPSANEGAPAGDAAGEGEGAGAGADDAEDAP